MWVSSTTTREFTNNAFIENRVGLWALVFTPASLSHERHDKELRLSQSEHLILNHFHLLRYPWLINQLAFLGYMSGATSSFDCTDGMPSSFSMSITKSTSWDANGGLVGMSSGNFDSGPNNAPEKPFRGRMSYPSIDGRVWVEGDVQAAHSD